MHEYSITKNLIEIAISHAQEVGASQVLEIKIIIGELSSVIDSSVQMYFDILSEGTILKGAKLTFTKVPVELFCKTCNRNFPKPQKGFECEICGNFGMPTDKGREFYIESIQVP